jgi:hypothetical protein
MIDIQEVEDMTKSHIIISIIIIIIRMDDNNWSTRINNPVLLTLKVPNRSQ